MKKESRYAIERKKLGISQEELAAKIGISQKSISKYEVGASRPSFEVLIAMSKLFHCSIDYLIENPYHESADLTASPEPSVPPLSARAQELLRVFDLLSGDGQDIIMGKAKDLLREERSEKRTLKKAE